MKFIEFLSSAQKKSFWKNLYSGGAVSSASESSGSVRVICFRGDFYPLLFFRLFSQSLAERDIITITPLRAKDSCDRGILWRSDCTMFCSGVSGSGGKIDPLSYPSSQVEIQRQDQNRKDASHFLSNGDAAGDEFEKGSKDDGALSGIGRVLDRLPQRDL